MCLTQINLLIWFFTFQILVNILDGGHPYDKAKRYKYDRKTSRNSDLRYHLHNSNDKKVNVGQFWKLDDQVERHEIIKGVFGSLDWIVSHLTVRQVCYYLSIGHFRVGRKSFEKASPLFISILITHLNLYQFKNFKCFVHKTSDSLGKTRIYINVNKTEAY